ncbi:hypothetical protein NA56DRAFT_702582 [Hyaloscypha hepaticicola]|uniref:Uncharacterized protein n=1 Tax=Hyaloscypha hepaticicola TaxID=2082293 RepID=A0A2J6Q7H8_9HELO|nr:hypothetical protein NA56DRAFT_702582 [Hyaloscypha hepaticicola]
MDADKVTELPWETQQTREIINLEGGKKKIILALAVIVAPNVILTAVLLGLILHNQVPQTYSQLPSVPDPPARESSAFLVDFSATRLLTVASWTSTLTSLLPSFAMLLVSFPVAYSIMNASKDKSTDDLPTPYQLSMLLGVLSGSIASLWNWFKYRSWEKRERVNGITKRSITWLVIVSVLGYLIVIADTWLHATTSTIQLLQALPSPSSVSAYGRGFYSSDCVSITGYTPCSVGISEKGPVYIQSTEAFKTFANVSSQNLVLSFPYEGQSYAFLTDPNVPQDTGYQASTFAVTTQCSFITHQCGVWWVDGPPDSFHCTSAFWGGLPNALYDGNFSVNPSWALAGVEFFQDPELTQNFSNGQSLANWDSFTPANPVYVGAYGIILGLTEGSPLTNLSSGDLAVLKNGLGFVMSCNMTAYDLEYVWYNGSVLVQQMVQSNISVVRTLTGPFVTELANLINLAQAAAGETTADGFRDSWTAGFSTMRAAQISTLVARVPKAPLAVLVLLSLLYAAVGILLACMALRARPSVSNNIQGRLSVAGLAAKCFEGEERSEGPTKEIQDLFGENEVGARDQEGPKVAIVASGRGGWKYDLVGQDERRNSATLTSRGNKSVEPFVRTISIS